jgi:Cation efflux family
MSCDAQHLALDDRPGGVRDALRLEYLTVGWNVVEGVIAITAALLAGSVALLGFGVDSFVETASGLILIWRLRAERRGMNAEGIERLDARAHKLVGASLFALAAYIAVDALHALWTGERPSPSIVGMVLTAISIVVMQWLARAKRRAAARLSSRALEADAFQTTACVWLSIIVLVGVGLNAVFGWWWADPVLSDPSHLRASGGDRLHGGRRPSRPPCRRRHMPPSIMKPPSEPTWHAPIMPPSGAVQPPSVPTMLPASIIPVMPMVEPTCAARARWWSMSPPIASAW